MLLAFQVEALITTTVSPYFYTIAVLEVIFPVSLILGPINVDVGAVPVGHIIEPLAVVYS